jgi:F0F1-type ATP synthase assembly protein I
MTCMYRVQIASTLLTGIVLGIALGTIICAM